MKTNICNLILALFVNLGISITCAGETALLSDAISKFNKKSKFDRIGVNQPAVTQAEVVAAILLWKKEPNSPVSENLLAQFKHIADSKKFPSNATFESINGYDRGGEYIFDVWSIRLVLEREDGSSYGFVIRDRVIGLRTLQEELDRLTQFIEEKNVEKWVGGYRYLDRKKQLEDRIIENKMNKS